MLDEASKKAQMSRDWVVVTWAGTRQGGDAMVNAAIKGHRSSRWRRPVRWARGEFSCQILTWLSFLHTWVSNVQ